MIISSWVCSAVVKFLTFFSKELGRPKKDENDQNHDISGGKAYKNIASTVCYWINYVISIII